MACSGPRTWRKASVTSAALSIKAKVRSRENSCDIAATRLTVKAAKFATDPDMSARTYRCGLVGLGLRCTTFTGTPPVAIEARSVARTSMRSVRLRRLRMTVVASLCWIGIMTRWISASCPRVGDEQLPDGLADLTPQELGPGGGLGPLELESQVLPGVVEPARPARPAGPAGPGDGRGGLRKLLRHQLIQPQAGQRRPLVEHPGHRASRL